MLGWIVKNNVNSVGIFNGTTLLIVIEGNNNGQTMFMRIVPGV